MIVSNMSKIIRVGCLPFPLSKDSASSVRRRIEFEIPSALHGHRIYFVRVRLRYVMSRSSGRALVLTNGVKVPGSVGNLDVTTVRDLNLGQLFRCRSWAE